MRSVPGALAIGPCIPCNFFTLDCREKLNGMWNDTDVPLAHLITFRTYGTWLHGDRRGSIDRFHNRYKSPYIEPNEQWHRHNREALDVAPVMLDAEQRRSVELSVRGICEFKRWHLYALNIRTNHVHIVVCVGSIKPERALTAFKANATKKMRYDGCWQQNSTPWAEKGSKRYLWNERSISQAVEYVVCGQGDDLPDFDG
jgi:REP element-mobilizing transposase RayT